MTDYTKLVEALRCAGLSKKCDLCDYGYHLCEDSECNDACDYERLDRDAAAAIEALQAEVDALHGRIEDEELKIDMLTADCTNWELATDKLKADVKRLKSATQNSMQNCRSGFQPQRKRGSRSGAR